MCGLCQTGWAVRFFAVLWLLKLCGMFKAWHSVEVDIGSLSSCCFIPEGGYRAESRLHGCCSNCTATYADGLSWWIYYIASLLMLPAYDANSS